MDAAKIKMFIGFDQHEAIAYHVYEQSIHNRSSLPVDITRIQLSELKHVHDRPWDIKQSNEFAFSRWLVPYLCNYKGWAIFTDCDMLCLDDIAKLWVLRDDRYAIMCTQHNHITPPGKKYLDRPQTPYFRKNWSSVMMFNNALCTKLTPEYVNTAHGLELHQLHWVTDDSLIGSIPLEWNHLVDVQDHNPDAKIVHWTLGGPYFDDYIDAPFAKEWFSEFKSTTHCTQREDL